MPNFSTIGAGEERAAQHVPGVSVPAAPVVVWASKLVPEGVAHGAGESEAEAVEAAAHVVRFLLRAQGGGSYRDVHVLLCGHSRVCVGPGGGFALLGRRLCALHYHPLERHHHSQVRPSAYAFIWFSIGP